MMSDFEAHSSFKAPHALEKKPSTHEGNDVNSGLNTEDMSLISDSVSARDPALLINETVTPRGSKSSQFPEKQQKAGNVHALDSLSQQANNSSIDDGGPQLMKLQQYISDLGGSLPSGWSAAVKVRASPVSKINTSLNPNDNVASSGSPPTATASQSAHHDVYYLNPQGKRFRSRTEVAKHLGLSVPFSNKRASGSRPVEDTATVLSSSRVSVKSTTKDSQLQQSTIHPFLLKSSKDTNVASKEPSSLTEGKITSHHSLTLLPNASDSIRDGSSDRTLGRQSSGTSKLKHIKQHASASMTRGGRELDKYGGLIAHATTQASTEYVDELSLPDASVTPPTPTRIQDLAALGRLSTSDVDNLMQVWVLLLSFHHALDLNLPPLSLPDLMAIMLCEYGHKEEQETLEGQIPYLELSSPASTAVGACNLLHLDLARVLHGEVLEGLGDWIRDEGLLTKRELSAQGSLPWPEEHNWQECLSRFLAGSACSHLLELQDAKAPQGSIGLPLSSCLVLLPAPDWQHHLMAGFNAPGGISRLALLPQGSSKTSAEVLMHEDDAQALTAAEAVMLMRLEKAEASGKCESTGELEPCVGSGSGGDVKNDGPIKSAPLSSSVDEANQVTTCNLTDIIAAKVTTGVKNLVASSTADIRQGRHLLAHLLEVRPGKMGNTQPLALFAEDLGMLAKGVRMLDLHVVAARLQAGLYSATGAFLEAMSADVRRCCSCWRSALRPAPRGHAEATRPAGYEAASPALADEVERRLQEALSSTSQLQAWREKGGTGKDIRDSGVGDPSQGLDQQQQEGNAEVQKEAEGGVGKNVESKEARGGPEDVTSTDIYGVHEPARPFSYVEGCRVCWRNEDTGRLLLCDNCDDEFHMYCLEPPLLQVPEGSWYCPTCVKKRQSVDDSELPLMLKEEWRIEEQVAGIVLPTGLSKQGVSRLRELLDLASMLRTKEYFPSGPVSIPTVEAYGLENTPHRPEVPEALGTSKLDSGSVCKEDFSNQVKSSSCWTPSDRVRLLKVLTELLLDSKAVRKHVDGAPERRREVRQRIMDIKAAARAREAAAAAAGTDPGLSSATVAVGPAGLKKPAKQTSTAASELSLLPSESAPVKQQVSKMKLPSAAQALNKEEKKQVAALERLADVEDERLAPLGSDRSGNRYWWLGAVTDEEERCCIDPGCVFVECPAASDVARIQGKHTEPSRQATSWGYYSTDEQLEQLTMYLHPKGCVEGPLRQALSSVRQAFKHAEALRKKQVLQEHEGPSNTTSVQPLPSMLPAQHHNIVTDEPLRKGLTESEGGAVLPAALKLSFYLQPQPESHEVKNKENEKGGLSQNTEEKHGERRKEPSYGRVLQIAKNEESEEADQSTESLASDIEELKDVLLEIYRGLPEASFTEFWGSEERQAKWVELVDSATTPCEIAAAIVLLENMVSERCLKPFWQLWAQPTQNPTCVGTWAGCWYRLTGFQASVKRNAGSTSHYQPSRSQRSARSTVLPLQMLLQQAASSCAPGAEAAAPHGKQRGNRSSGTGGSTSATIPSVPRIRGLSANCGGILFPQATSLVGASSLSRASQPTSGVGRPSALNSQGEDNDQNQLQRRKGKIGRAGKEHKQKSLKEDDSEIEDSDIMIHAISSEAASELEDSDCEGGGGILDDKRSLRTECAEEERAVGGATGREKGRTLLQPLKKRYKYESGSSIHMHSELDQDNNEERSKGGKDRSSKPLKCVEPREPLLHDGAAAAAVTNTHIHMDPTSPKEPQLTVSKELKEGRTSGAGTSASNRGPTALHHSSMVLELPSDSKTSGGNKVPEKTPTGSGGKGNQQAMMRNNASAGNLSMPARKKLSVASPSTSGASVKGAAAKQEESPTPRKKVKLSLDAFDDLND
ncbi:hypothetical protein CEUSTIGMA_g6703.t1 [Chlamydomonas eustigma]|uniref:PHD-type domain-containing protein n=1 Tax=Chlamydomonas eustigma TaxID=1157962 RepID=A0A250X863_9CHLO|nr:hypothetical protein CEUSTIGMA_g6703.t1 [Chlamydomonas eustigma]|eukprot:GAX79263.1 hypothetical protein CEUSTIGMA_g6703.t1 [Chlamydomonas eustigma]